MTTNTQDVLKGSWIPSHNTDIDGDDEIVLADAHFDRPEFTDTDRARTDADVAETLHAQTVYFERLSELRRAMNITQTQVAQHMGTSQPAVATIEAKSDVRLSTLARYLDAIGGSADVIVSFNDQTQVRIPLDQLLTATP
jgi:DNA-binding XRE family transcriptional regulator